MFKTHLYIDVELSCTINIKDNYINCFPLQFWEFNTWFNKIYTKHSFDKILAYLYK